MVRLYICSAHSQLQTFLLLYFKGMNDVQLHSLLGRCSDHALESIFPSSDRQFITCDEMKAVSVFEVTEGHEQTISFWLQYLTDLAKYVRGAVMFQILLF